MKSSILLLATSVLYSLFLTASCGDGSKENGNPDNTCQDVCAQMISVCPDDFNDPEKCQTECLDGITKMEETSADAQVACIMAAKFCEELNACIENIPSDGVDPVCIPSCEKLTEICPDGFGEMDECLAVCSDMLETLGEQEKSDMGDCIMGITDCEGGYECVGIDEPQQPEEADPIENNIN
jgi:hypothetical protein